MGFLFLFFGMFFVVVPFSAVACLVYVMNVGCT